MEKLTTKQQQYYDFIKKYIEEKGYSPAIRDICKEFGKSPGTIHPILKKMKLKGAIDFEPKMSRTIKILNS